MADLIVSEVERINFLSPILEVQFHLLFVELTLENIVRNLSSTKIPPKSEFFSHHQKIVGPNPFALSIGHHLESELFPYLLHFSRFYHS